MPVLIDRLFVKSNITKDCETVVKTFLKRIIQSCLGTRDIRLETLSFVN